MLRSHEYAARLCLSWLNERYHRAFTPTGFDVVGHAADPELGDLVVTVAELAETNDAWYQRCQELATRLDASRPGSYLLWVPPGGELPAAEPDESEWVRRVVLAASKLASGRDGEVRLPVRLALGKTRDEGGYASVTGGLGRYWTTISERLEGSFFLDSRGLNRFTRDEAERQQLYEHIGLLGQGLATGDVAEFEHEDAWSLQRLGRGPAGAGLSDGWAICGCPPGFDPDDGGAIRRLLRRRLAEATAASAAPGLHLLLLLGAYEYLDYENAGPSLRGFDPALTTAWDAIVLVADAAVKPLLLKRGRFGPPDGT